MTDTYLDKEGRECARLRYDTPPRVDPNDDVRYLWRKWVLTRIGREWAAMGLSRNLTAPTLAALRRKLVEEDKR